MRVAIFTDVFLEVPGGICSSIKAQKAGLEKLGHEVTVFCPGWHPEKDKSIVIVPTNKILRAGGAPLAKTPDTVKAWILEKYPEFKFDVVHVHYEAGCSIAGMQLAKQFKIPLVQTMHGREDVAIQTNVPHPFKTLAGVVLCGLHGKWIPHSITISRDDKLAPTVTRAKMWTLMVNHANFADAVVTPSHHFAKKLKQYGVKHEITVVSNAIEDAAANAVDWKVRKVAKDGALKVFWNSRVSHEKRVMPFLEAVRLATERGAKLEVNIYGAGNALGKAKRYVKKAGLEKVVKFYGMVPHEEILEKMKEQHLSALASYGFDIQPMTLLEAEAAGLPVMFCDPDMKEVVPAAGAAFCDKPSAEGMAKVLVRLSKHPEEIEKMSKVMLGARVNVLQSTQIRKLLEVYKRAGARDAKSGARPASRGARSTKA